MKIKLDTPVDPYIIYPDDKSDVTVKDLIDNPDTRETVKSYVTGDFNITRDFDEEVIKEFQTPKK